MWPFLGSLIGAGTSLFGGLMGQNNASQQFWQNVKMSNRAMKKQQYWNKQSLDFANKQFDFSKMLAKIGLKRSTLNYRMKEARAAGVHPLYALGAGGAGGSPSVQVGSPSFSSGGSTAGYSGDGGLASGIAQMGQHLGRAVDSMATADQRNEVRLLSALNIENQGLQNELLRSQIRRIDAQTGPAIPGPGQKYLIDGQGNTIGKVNTDAVTFSQRYPEAKQNIQVGPIHQANPHVSNAEDVEARHGELADMLWGAVTIPADIYWNYIRNRSPSNYVSDMYGGNDAVSPWNLERR